MSTLDYSEKKYLEKKLKMDEGYVLDFSNKTFREFFQRSIGVNIDDQKYCIEDRGSKANRLRAFFKLESNFLVAKILTELHEHSQINNLSDLEVNDSYYIKNIDRLNANNEMDCSFFSKAMCDDEKIQECIYAINSDIKNGKPKNAMDRLHTLMNGCLTHLMPERDKAIPLESAYGQYIKKLDLEEEERNMLKSHMQFLKQFNVIRNNKSLAHSNDLIKDNNMAFYIIKVVFAILFILCKKKL